MISHKPGFEFIIIFQDSDLRQDFFPPLQYVLRTVDCQRIGVYRVLPYWEPVWECQI